MADEKPNIAKVDSSSQNGGSTSKGEISIESAFRRLNVGGSKEGDGVIREVPAADDADSKEEIEDGHYNTYDSVSSSDLSDFDEYEQCDCVDDKVTRPDRIPYSAVYDTQDEVRKRGYFNPSQSISAKIINVERDTSSAIHLINPYIYTIELQHGKYTWTIYRRYIDFQHLHNRLLLFRAASKVTAPIRKIKRRNVPLETTLLYDQEKQLVECDQGKHLTEGNTAKDYADDVPLETLHHTGLRNLQHQQSTAHGTSSEPVPLALEQLHVDTQVTPETTSGDQRKHRHRHVHSSSSQSPRKRRPCKLPRFPMLPDSVISQERMEERKLELQRYLSAVLHVYVYRNHHETAEFLEVSRLSFVHNLGAKCKEGLVKKRPGGIRQYHGCKRFCITYCAKWSVRWLVIKDSFVAYLHPRTEQIRHVMLFDADFSVRAGHKETEGVKRGLIISNMQRNLVLKCYSVDEAKIWKRSIEETIGGVGKIWLDSHRFGASYPVRENCYAQFFVDGSPFMDHVANMLELAKEEIFITDWWLSPEIYLKRPMTEGDRWRLDELLKRKANEGVRIFVLLYKEVTMALGISSYYSKKQLMEKHPNIKVLRHPDHLPGTGVLLWAHHEKVIVVDQNIAFIGGIDLCYGRWDNHQHKLSDLGSVHYQAEHVRNLQPKNLSTGMKNITQMFGTLSALEIEGLPMPEQFAQNGTTPEQPPAATAEEAPTDKDEVDTVTVASNTETGTVAKSADEKKEPSRAARLWSKAAGITRLQRFDSTPGHPARPAPSPLERFATVGATSSGQKMDLGEVVKKYRQLVESGVIQAEKARGTPPTKRKRNKVAKYLKNWKDAHARRKREEQDEPIFATEYEAAWRKLQEESQIDLGLAGCGKLWMGKDYVNFIHKDFTDLDLPFHDFIDRAVTPRMPWHDVACVVYGSAARDAARHFIQRWNACKIEKVKDDADFPFLIPKSYENVQVPRVFQQIASSCNVQILRSASLWSVGMNATEESIHRAYLQMIKEAEHFIYIENQFFVSQIGGTEIHNQVAKAVFDRIVRAHKNNESFRVYVLMPLLPGFEGQLGTTGASALQAVLHWTYVSISKGPHSLLRNLEQEIGDPSRYITFCSLRTHGELVGRLVTELLYIHSKTMIVDDRKCIIGSANINDRSLLGKRDSEVAIYIEDTQFFSTTMNGKPYNAGKFSGGLRRRLFKEHLCLLDGDNPTAAIDIEDIASEKFFNMWKEIAIANEEIYEKVFACIPCDQVDSFEALSKYQQQIPLCEYNRGAAMDMLKKLRGRLVAFPTKFLINSNLTPSIASKEGLAPAYLFT